MTEMLDSHPAITSYGEMLENSPMHKISQQYHYWKKSLIGSDKIGAGIVHYYRENIRTSAPKYYLLLQLE